MILSCDTVMDLISIYKDGLASSDSVRAIEAHLKDCPSCRKYYKLYDTTGLHSAGRCRQMPSDGYTEHFVELASKLRKTHIISNAAIIGIAGLSLSLMVISLVKLRKKYNIPDAQQSRLQ